MESLLIGMFVKRERKRGGYDVLNFFFFFRENLFMLKFMIKFGFDE